MCFLLSFKSPLTTNCLLCLVMAVMPGKYMVAQSLDNQILVFGARDRFRQNRKKAFKGAAQTA